MFELIASDLRLKGYSVQKDALPPGLISELLDTFTAMPSGVLKPAGIGRARTASNRMQRFVVTKLRGSKAHMAALRGAG